MKFSLFIVLIITITILSISKSLNFSLAGDDWAALYYYHLKFDSFLSLFQISHYLGIYDFSFILIGTIEKFFGLNPFIYYLISMIIRIVSAISFYPAVLSLTKDKKAAYLSCILFAFTYAGIESTNWVFNMTTYISLGLFNLFLWQYFTHISKQSLKSLALESFFIFLSFYATPNRMAPILIILPILEILSLKKFNFISLTKRCLRIILLLSPIVIFHLITATASDKSYISLIPQLSFNNFNIIFYFFSNIGSALIPDRVLQVVLPSLSTPGIKSLGSFIQQSLLVAIFFAILVYLLSLSLLRKTYYLVSAYSLIVIYSLIFFISLQGSSINQFGNSLVFLNTLIGGYFVIIFSLYFIKLKDSFPYLYRAGIFSIFSSLLFLIPSWLAFNGSYPSDHRYLLIPTAFLMISISVIATALLKQENKSLKTLSNLVIPIIIIMNSLSLQSYFNMYLSQGRKADYADKLFTQIQNDENYSYNNKPLVFLFTTDNPFKLYNSITFGFPYHSILTNKKFGLDIQKAPFVVDNFESLVNVISSENSSELKRYGYKPVKIPIENVYFYKFENDRLTNVTKEGRESLTKELSILK